MQHIKSEISTFHLSLAAPEFNLYLASLAVYGYGQTLSDFFFSLLSVAEMTSPKHSPLTACEKDCSLTDQFHDDAWQVGNSERSSTKSIKLN